MIQSLLFYFKRITNSCPALEYILYFTIKYLKIIILAIENYILEYT